jgi:predicted DNA-binding antitoxin AbrB/MazE fold protein
MTKVHAIFENGVFRPVEPVQIDDGVRVELTIEETAEPSLSSPPLQALIEIAQLPIEGPDDGFSGTDHDRMLYGERQRR